MIMSDQQTPETGRIGKGGGPTCKECGAPMYHSRLHGYCCMRDPRHGGIIWPEPNWKTPQRQEGAE